MIFEPSPTTLLNIPHDITFDQLNLIIDENTGKCSLDVAALFEICVENNIDPDEFFNQPLECVLRFITEWYEKQRGIIGYIHLGMEKLRRETTFFETGDFQYH